MKKLTAFALVLALVGVAGAATYDWDGSEGDGNWYTPANWTVSGSSWTYPNDQYEFGATPYRINEDAR